MSRLVDLMGRKHTYLRVSVTDRCNLRCTYCMPSGGICKLPSSDILSLEETTRVCRVFAGLGVTKVRLTGGEPLVRQGIVELARAIASLSGVEQVGMTTNGVLLAPLAAELAGAGVSRINVSLDTLKPERFRKITLHDSLDSVLEGIQAALGAGFTVLNLNAVVISGVNDDEILEFVELTRAMPICVRFIEYMPVGRQWSGPTPHVPTARLMETISAHYDIAPMGDAPGLFNVAKLYSVEGMRGTLGFIPSVTEHFCGHCSRMRVTADGRLKTCLHYPAELSLKDAMRNGASDKDLEKLIVAALMEKRVGRPLDANISADAAECLEAGSMYEIGG